MNPDNVYCATKRIGQLLIRPAARSRTTFAAVRFGNMHRSGSRAKRRSVHPGFAPIDRGGPWCCSPIRRPTRFQMAVEEAASLVIQAASFAEQGQIFNPGMGEPIRTAADPADKMIRLKA